MPQARDVYIEREEAKEIVRERERERERDAASTFVDRWLG